MVHSTLQEQNVFNDKTSNLPKRKNINLLINNLLKLIKVRKTAANKSRIYSQKTVKKITYDCRQETNNSLIAKHY